METCSIPECAGRVAARGWCNKHYLRWRRHRDPEQVKPTHQQCAVADCDREAAGRGWCKMHWRRWRTHGDPEYVRPAPPPRPRCAVEDCDREKHTHIYCSMHFRRWQKSGDPLIVGPRHPGRNRLDAPSYDGMHKRLFYDRGLASAHACVTCGEPAREWSYDGGDPDELIGDSGGHLLAYSTDQDRYSPRCIPCHRRMDLSLHRNRDSAGRWASGGVTIHRIEEDRT